MTEPQLPVVGSKRTQLVLAVSPPKPTGQRAAQSSCRQIVEVVSLPVTMSGANRKEPNIDLLSVVYRTWLMRRLLKTRL